MSAKFPRGGGSRTFFSLKSMYYPSPDWSSAFCDRSTNVLSVAYTVHIRFVRYTSVTHTAKSVSSPFFVRCLSVTYVLCAPYTFREDPHRHTETTFIAGGTSDKHFLHFFFLSVRRRLPLSINI